MVGNRKYEKINMKLNALLEEKEFLIVSHRGSWGGNILENTKESVLTAVNTGADFIEIDLVKSKDDDYYCFHTGNELRLFKDETIDVEQLSSKEIRKLSVHNSISEATSSRLNTIDEVFQGISNMSFINLDRSWDYWVDLLPKLEKKEYRDSIILKSPVRYDLLKTLESCETKFMYFPIVSNTDELNLLKEFDINIVGLELLASTENDAFFSAELVSTIQSEMNVFILLNAIVLNDERKLFAGYDDTVSILEGPEHGWGKLLEHGANAIHTDWTAELNIYREELKNNKSQHMVMRYPEGVQK